MNGLFIFIFSHLKWSGRIYTLTAMRLFDKQ